MNRAAATVLYATIPAILGLGALYWLTFGQGLHAFDRLRTQEKRQDARSQRLAEYVAAPVPQTVPLKIIIGKGPLRVDRAEVDEQHLTVYYSNHTGQHQCYGMIDWKLKSPDETIIKSGGGYVENTEAGIDSGEHAEYQTDFASDERAVSLTISTRSQTAC